MEKQEFFELAKERFGDKIVIQKLKVKEDVENIPWTKEEVAAYPEQAWVVDGFCPVCGASLGGLFGSFKWSMVHGIGQCGVCDKATFRYYHYIVKGIKPLCAFALIGFD